MYVCGLFELNLSQKSNKFELVSIVLIQSFLYQRVPQFLSLGYHSQSKIPDTKPLTFYSINNNFHGFLIIEICVMPQRFAFLEQRINRNPNMLCPSRNQSLFSVDDVVIKDL